MADKSNEPLALWQKMMGEMEKGFNAFANQAMASPQFSKAVNQVGGVTADAQKQLGELMEKYLVSMNMPSRSQLIGMAERLQSIEAQLGEIKTLLMQMNGMSGMTNDSVAAAPRPPRTKRPPAPRRGVRDERDRWLGFRGTRSRLDPGSDPDRGAARDPARRQGRRISRPPAPRSARRQRTS